MILIELLETTPGFCLQFWFLRLQLLFLPHIWRVFAWLIW